MNQLAKIEHQNQRVLTTVQLAESYGTQSNTITVNFSRNKQRYTEGKHFYCLDGDELREFKGNLTNCNVAQNVNTLYLWTEKGAWLHAKSLNTDKAWEAYEMLVDEYYRVKDGAPALEGLSPQLQVLISLELKTKQLEEKQEIIERRLTLVKDTLINRDEDWRKWLNITLNKVAKAAGGDYQKIKSESYKILEERGRCNLNIRLNNLRERLKSEGATKTKINSTNRLDVIESEPRLKEIYDAIVKELAIRYTA